MKQTTLDFKLSPSYLESDFTVAACNEFAKAQIDIWPNWPGYGLLLVGEKASGKSHLAQIWLKTSKANLAMGNSDIAHLAGKHVLIDDADMWKSSAEQEKLFHILNLVKENQKTILLTASCAPTKWQISLPDLQSRLNALPQAKLNPPDEALLSSVLAKHFHDRQIHVDADVIQYIVARQERSLNETHRIAQLLDEAALEQKRPITLALTRQTLAW